MAASTCIEEKVKGSELKRGLLASALSPLVVIAILPVAMLIEAFSRGFVFDFRFAVSAGMLGTYLAYWGMIVFGVPMYFVLRLTRRSKLLPVAIAAIAGWIAALTTLDILQLIDSPTHALEDIRTVLTYPFFLSMWLNSATLSGAFVGIAFWFIARPGKNELALRQVGSG